MDLMKLPWLPAPAPDFRAQVRQARSELPTVGAAATWRRLRVLATTALDQSLLTPLSRLSRDLSEAPGAGGDAPRTLRVRLLSNATVDLVATALEASAPRHGLLARVEVGAFGSWYVDAIGATAGAPGCDVAWLALDHRAFDWRSPLGDADVADRVAEAAVAQVLQAASSLVASGCTAVLVQTLAEPPGSQLGSLDAQVPGSLRWLIQRFNSRLLASRHSGLLVLDLAALVAQVGSASWFDTGLWHLAKLPCSPAAIPLYVDHVARLLMAQAGLAKKCLVLDLDNTLWGGVIGDDGLAGIHLAQGHPIGEAHLALQQVALALRERGVVLAVCSKNDEANARLPFREHPDMLLKESHFAVFCANWQDKAGNLRNIAKTLNIGVDALVFVDDNPAERHLVRSELPEVAVPEMPPQPHDYAGLLMAAGYFDAVSFTAEDRHRADLYGMAAAQHALLESSSDMAGYLESLEMVGTPRAFDALSRARITQLVNKTNQFNLTTRRRTELEVAALESDPNWFTLQFRLRDRFGDHGMIGVVIARKDRDAWWIDTWLMSCRVLKRRVEEAMLAEVIRAARGAGVRALIGTYIPSAKNAMVAEHYMQLGFTPHAGPMGQNFPAGSRHFELVLDGHTSVELPIRLETGAQGTGPN